MIDLESANLGELELRELELCLKGGVVSTRGALTQQFESEMAKYLGVQPENVLATNSGTAALYLSLRQVVALQSEAIILPVLTFIASANAIAQGGKALKFVDVDQKTWCIDFTKIEENCFSTILGVNLYGNICNWSKLLSHCCCLIEDACESLGVQTRCANLINYSCYSFNGNKVMTTGGGGMLVGEKQSILIARMIASQGIYEGNCFTPGFNYRMPALNASLGLAQLKRLPEFLAKKKRINTIYRNELSNLCTFQEPGEEGLHSYWYSAGTFKIPAEILQLKLKEKGIPTRRIFKPIPLEPAYHFEGAENQFPIAKWIYDYGLCLPSGTINRDMDIFETCKTIKTIL